ncbi:MAG TPA: hypothetical protein VFT59_02645 [Candidatus Saccharimonadales bacterium]|nr:hypothetical protein [Candidatus Saccharimonadales bacterium]
MKRLLMITAAFSAVGLTALVWQVSVQAQSTPMTEAHIERIRANCVDAQSVLTQLHASDALLRVNRGQLYESISTKLMAPFNSRVALNKYDGSKLIAQSAKYEQQLNEFRTNYKAYDEAISKVLRINCTNEPVAFYDSVGEARSKRALVHQSVIKLQETIQGYKTEFEAFATALKERS